MPLSLCAGCDGGSTASSSRQHRSHQGAPVPVWRTPCFQTPDAHNSYAAGVPLSLQIDIQDYSLVQSIQSCVVDGCNLLALGNEQGLQVCTECSAGRIGLGVLQELLHAVAVDPAVTAPEHTACGWPFAAGLGCSAEQPSVRVAAATVRASCSAARRLCQVPVLQQGR